MRISPAASASLPLSSVPKVPDREHHQSPQEDRARDDALPTQVLPERGPVPGRRERLLGHYFLPRRFLRIQNVRIVSSLRSPRRSCSL